MLWSDLLVAMMIPAFDHAESGDTFITVEYVVQQMKVRPSPMLKHGRSTINIVLHSNGTIDDSHHGYGRYAKPTSKTIKRLGADTYKVVNQNSIKRVSHTGDLTRTVTVTVSGRSCSANVELTLKSGKTEYKGYSSELGTKAYYTNPKLERASCTIR